MFMVEASIFILCAIIEEFIDFSLSAKCELNFELIEFLFVMNIGMACSIDRWHLIMCNNIYF